MLFAVAATAAAGSARLSKVSTVAPLSATVTRKVPGFPPAATVTVSWSDQAPGSAA